MNSERSEAKENSVYSIGDMKKLKNPMFLKPGYITTKDCDIYISRNEKTAFTREIVWLTDIEQRLCRSKSERRVPLKLKRKEVSQTAAMRL